MTSSISSKHISTHRTLTDVKGALLWIVTSGKCLATDANGIAEITGDHQKRKTKAKDCRATDGLFVVILNLV